MYAYYPVDEAKLCTLRHDAKRFARKLGQGAEDDVCSSTECWFAIKQSPPWSVATGLWDDPNSRRRAYRRGPPLVRIGEVYVYSEKITYTDLREDLITRWVALGGDRLAMLPEPPAPHGARQFQGRAFVLDDACFRRQQRSQTTPPLH